MILTPRNSGTNFNLEGENITGYRYMIHLYCLAVQAGFYSDVVECLPVTQTARVRSPAAELVIRIFHQLHIENLKNLLVRNHWTDCYTIFRNVPLVILYQYCSSHLDLSENMAARGGGWGGRLFSLYIFIENLKDLLVRNHWTDFIITWQKYFHGDPLRRLFK